MQELSEHMWGFDRQMLGFPSIAACRAVVLQTTAGLFGYHMLSSHEWAETRAKKFAEFVHGHMRWADGSGQMLYVITYTESPATGYSEGKALTQWKTEAEVFAKALNFTGRRLGYSLSPTNGALSSYVRVVQSVGMPEIWTAPWTQNVQHVTEGTLTKGDDLGWLESRVSQDNRAVKVDIPTLKRVNPQSLD